MEMGLKKQINDYYNPCYRKKTPVARIFVVLLGVLG